MLRAHEGNLMSAKLRKSAIKTRVEDHRFFEGCWDESVVQGVQRASFVARRLRLDISCAFGTVTA
jgi:hypothetical protein